MNSDAIVQKLWNYCNVLRDDGMSYGDYVEQLTYLLFLKMADERTKPPYNQPSAVPAKYNWPSAAQEGRRRSVRPLPPMLEELGKEKGLLGLIFNKSQNKFQDPAKLRRLIVDLIDKENWSAMSADVKGDAYEGLLEKNAQDTKSGAGQYFTPRPLIQAMVDVHRPEAERDHLRPGLRHRRVSACRARLHREAQPEPDRGREAPAQGRHLQGLGAGAGHGAAVRHEPDAARHRERQGRAHRRGRLAWPPTPASASTSC